MLVDELVKEFSRLDPSERSEWVELRDAMAVHTDGDRPIRLLETRRPNEPEDVKKYRIEIYQPVTRKGITKAKDIVGRVFTNASFSWKVPQAIEPLLMQPNFEGKDFFKFMFSDCFDEMIKDANAYIAWLPDFENIEANKPNLAKPYIIPCYKIKHVSKELFCWETDLKQEQKVSGGNREVVPVYYAIDKDFIYKLYRRGQGYVKEVIMPNITGEITACVLGGNSKKKGVLESFFWGYTPWANEAIRLYSDLQATMVTSAFPTRIEMVEDCDAAGCVNGNIYDTEARENHTCKSCNGTGKKSTSSPYGVYQFLPKTALHESGGSFAPLSYVAPPTDIIELQEKAVQAMLDRAEDALHLSTVDEAQSGEAKKVDREGQYSLLSKISTNIFEGYMHYSLRWIVKYYSETPEYQNYEVELSQPVSYTIRSEADLTDELKALNEAKAPEVFKMQVIDEIAKKRFGGDANAHRILQVVSEIDPYFVKTDEDKVLLWNAGVISKESFLRSINAAKALQRVMRSRGRDVMLLEIGEIINLVNAELDTIVKTESGAQGVNVPPVDANFNV